MKPPVCRSIGSAITTARHKGRVGIRHRPALSFRCSARDPPDIVSYIKCVNHTEPQVVFKSPICLCTRTSKTLSPANPIFSDGVTHVLHLWHPTHLRQQDRSLPPFLNNSPTVFSNPGSSDRRCGQNAKRCCPRHFLVECDDDSGGRPRRSFGRGK